MPENRDPGMSKLGVLTFHRCVNYGAYWQARCLLEHLRELGHEAELLDHFSSRSIWAEWPRLMRPTRPAPRFDVVRSINKILKFLAAQHRLARTRTFAPRRPPRCEEFDSIIVGSDEVWNIGHPWYGNEPLFFGEGLNPRRLISYAPSFGNYHVDGGLPDEWAGRLRRFHRISVRDRHSARIVRETLRIEPAVVLDPCLQFSPKSFQTPPASGEAGFLLIYAMQLDPPFVHQVRTWARQRRLKIVSVGYRHMWADVSLPSAGPEEFLRCFQGARAVVTSFFHGCVFALRFKRPFVAQVPDYRANKVNGLLAMAGATERFIRMGESFDARLLDDPLAAAVTARIEERRRVSSEFLAEALVA